MTDILPILQGVDAAQDVRAAAWDAFHLAHTPEQLRGLLEYMPLPRTAKAALWDAKFPQEQPLPEAPETMDIQVGQLASGLRRAVYFPRGTPLVKRPKNAKALETPQGTFLYDPTRLDSATIIRAHEAGRLNDILGAASGGMGPQSKDDIAATGEQPLAVVGKTPTGETTQGTLATPSRIQQTIQQTAKVTPRGTVSIEQPEQVLAERLRKRKGAIT